MASAKIKTVKAFSDPNYDYYRLTKDFGLLKAGTIFFHDPDDDVYGSIAQGCLKNCWTSDGNCENSLCGSTVILHYEFIHTDWFEKVERNFESLMGNLSTGHYKLDVYSDGSWNITKTCGVL